ncbi:hypothetical protein M406DRAFT_287661 [Cryphonectria parasitica EP155]|uniref:Caffeine-induced death protein Cid2 n=1 Tax=Cryphonectria parasitica (strain ATCC 38755 / EP155) TaxID=660469 RepID=A0A9P4Y4E5_CRYP1|nr:uncharacterized protein M406DRAFT_287661 [Cryphonectria parasitica EP155]KAF3766732.1 hypothetical protein M406DRAFT_287661 [Cryphonectria parasitica EP155]
MSEPTAQPKLTPQFCFSSTALRDFLRISRGTIDDTIAQNLNALVTPASAGFDPSSTWQRNPRPSNHRQIDARSCRAFKDQVLFPSWQARSDILSYCAAVATSPDPDDPAAAARGAELERNRGRVPDERLDPYSARFFPTEPRTAQLAMLVRQEEGVERIVRTRTWGLVRDRCGDSDAQDWQVALASWRGEHAGA